MGYASEAIQNLERDEHAVREDCGCPRCDRLRAEQRGFNRAIRVVVKEVRAILSEKGSGATRGLCHVMLARPLEKRLRARYPEAFENGGK